MKLTTSVEIQAIDSQRDQGFGYRARFGVIVLATDQTIEIDLATLQHTGLAWHYARIPMAITTSPETLTSMHAHLQSTAALFPRDFALNAIGYACTSASTLIGDDKVAAQIQREHPGVPCTNPILAGITGLRRLNARRIALLTPYSEEITREMAEHFARSGVQVSRIGSFLEPNELQVPRITTESIVAGALQLGADPDCDALFIACTSLRTFSIIDQLERALGKPVVSSNQAMAWHLLRLAGIEDEPANLGRLFAQGS